ncbi:SAM-dependent methyltransferase [Ferrovibrio sp. MS7]|uniref:class I SAM-dependent methyltransferase n=1 Tax=Ferrovibrio plantarum TaxID=3119164 RepID=UPI00313710A5
MTAPLLELIRRRIAAEGPISLSDYMAECLLHPQFGYYTTRESIGAAGDFITAPEISQMFGELLGLWAADCWQRIGAPSRCYLVELGPGRGTLMQDALRATRKVAPFLPLFVEASPKLRAMQAQAVPDATWCAEIAALPDDAPLIVLGNEFLDALPIKQYQRQHGAWRERRIAASDDGGLHIVLSRDAFPLARTAPEGSIWETSPASHAVIEALAARLQAQGGAALFIDYGPETSGFGDSFQAVRGHAYADPLATPGEVDLTAHVDFQSLGQTARRAGLNAHGPIGQGALLNRLGIGLRAQQLKARATPAQAEAIDGALHRLTADAAMGRLFQALALTLRDAPPPAGFAP